MRRALLSLLVVVAAACAPASAADRVSVDLGEFYVDVASSNWNTNGVGLTIGNSGEYGHTLVITDEDEMVVAAVDVIQPGETSEISLALEPGSFRLTCRIVIERAPGVVVDHFEEGMLAEVTVSP